MTRSQASVALVCVGFGLLGYLTADWLRAPRFKHVVAGVIRNTGTGWEAITSDGHSAIGIARVRQDDKSIIIEYDFRASRVVTFIVTPDETYAVEDRLICGSSVRLSHAVIQCSTNAGGVAVNPASLTKPFGNLWLFGLFE